VKAVAPLCDLLLVVGSQNSSNSRRLVEVCAKAGVSSYLIDDAGEVKSEWLKDVATLAVTAGASAPENLVRSLIETLQRNYGFGEVEEVEVKEEDVRFSLPPELAQAGARLTNISR
jgi:4-hydroxy-3-methylbut-2-enyl diphosphate reductase